MFITNFILLMLVISFHHLYSVGKPFYNMEHFRVIIVGAGPAGVAAAAKLIENDVNDLVILEAENRIGGRINSSEIDGNLIELGAEWIHGEKDNIVYEMASTFNLTCNDVPETIFVKTNFYESGNNQIDKNISTILCCMYEEIIYTAFDDKNKVKGSLGEYFIKKFRERLKEVKEEINVSDELAEKFMDVFEKWENSIDASDSWFETSFLGHLEYWECEGNKLTFWKDVGYSTIFDLLERFPMDEKRKPVIIDEKTKLNKEVIKIIWNKNDVIGIPNVIVECSDGTKFSSEYIILTFPLGVLKEKVENLFVPPLSNMKLNSIKGLGFGTVDKIFLKFSYPWWTDDIDGFAFLWSDGDKMNDSSGWISEVIAFHPIRPESSILRGWIIGEAARKMEILSDEEVLSGCMLLLNKFLGFKYNIPPAEAISRSTWYSNPHFRGSYSCRLLESDNKNAWASHLAQPVCNNRGKPLLLFAGEATHDHYYSTVHGAIESGQREADRLFKNIMNINCLKDTYEVVIVGAGISGLSAAKTLCENGITDILILEAQDQPGGRIRSVKVDNEWLELGAQWIHGDKNELYNICLKHDLLSDMYSQEGEGLYLRENGTVVDELIVREVDDVIKNILEDCEEYVKGKDSNEIPISVGEELLSKFNEYLMNCNDSKDVIDVKKDLFYWHVRFHLIDNSCDDLNNLSARAWGLFRFCGGNDYINFKNGFKSIVDVLVNCIPNCAIKYSTPVNLIKWNETLVLDDCMNGELSSPGCSYDAHKDNNMLQFRKHCAKVVCNNNFSYNANYVIVTSSLGYLKNNHKKIFYPPLPLHISEAINSLGFGILSKIFLIYNEPWWDPHVKGFQIVWSHQKFSDRNEKHWSVYVTGFDVIKPNKPILLGWVGSEGARMVENMTEHDVGVESTEILRRFTRNQKIPHPRRVLKSNWFGNGYVQGGYSHITTNYESDQIDSSNLSCPVYTNVYTKGIHFKKPTILFAGEASHQTHFSTVHGAYDSGVNQAHNIINDIKRRRR